MNNKERPKQISIRFDDKQYEIINNLSKEQNISFAKMVNQLVAAGLENQNESRKLEWIDRNVTKILSKLKYNCDLTAQLFVNKRFAQNFKQNEDKCYKEFKDNFYSDKFTN